MANLFANNRDPDQMPHSVASDLGLHCLPITLLGLPRLQWVNIATKSVVVFFSKKKKIYIGEALLLKYLHNYYVSVEKSEKYLPHTSSYLELWKSTYRIYHTEYTL